MAIENPTMEYVLMEELKLAGYALKLESTIKCYEDTLAKEVKK